jgi:hypothetical protein
MTDRIPYARVFRTEDELSLGFGTLAGRLGIPQVWMEARLTTPRNRSSRGEGLFTEALAERALPLVAEDLARFGYDADSWRAY